MKTSSHAVAAMLLCLVSALPVHAQTVAPARSASANHLGVGLVRSVDVKARTLTISHQPMPSLGMTAMTMDFLVVRALPLRNVNEGDTVAFVLGRSRKSNDVAIVALQKVQTTFWAPRK